MRFPRRLAQPQPNGYTCGPAALRHALLCYGEEHSIPKLAELCKTREKNCTPQANLERAARKLGYDLYWECSHEGGAARAGLEAWIRHTAAPVILCVDRAPDGPWQHWITVVGATDSYVTIVDSALEKPVRRISWARLLQRLAVFEQMQNRFDLYPLIEAA